MKKMNQNTSRKFAVSFILLLSFSLNFIFAEDSALQKNQILDPQEEKTSEEIPLEAAESKSSENKKTELDKLELKQKKKEAKQAARDKRREKVDKILGITYVPEKNYEIKRGNLKLDFRSDTGTFNVFAISENKSETALFSNFDNSKSTFFMADIDGKSYRLNQDAGVSKQLRRLENSMQLAFNIEKKMQVVVDFSLVSSTAGLNEDMVMFTIYSSNLSKKNVNYSLKAVFDTVLGEGTDYHFISTSGIKITGEKQFDNIKNERAFISTNGKTSLQILLDGKNITRPKYVSFANKNALISGPWIPVITSGKSFNSVLSYNNSAVAINWEEQILKPEETSVCIFYIACGIDNQMPDGFSYVDPVEQNEEKDMFTVESVTPPEMEIKKPEVEFIVPPIDDSQLDPVYIQNLINKINSLQSDPKYVDRNQIRQLNSELDAIMEKIRQRQQR